MKIRPAESSDFNTLMKLRLSLQKHTEKSNSLIWRVTEGGMEGLKKELEEMVADEDSRILVAEKDGEEIVGFIAGRVLRNEKYRPRWVGKISLLYVEVKHRRQGVGKSLVEKLLMFFNSKNVEDVTLRYVSGNKEAENFWKEFEFDPVIITANQHLEGLI
ncbi:hypothetical protein AKJ57_02640 [candidate division MSBL1 archaeon SCGC-AAA259A05]|uniref:N-acetyltransferase domain-containing protein n=1 Tax=candidate division MSBL1 archaeon SCGC-AAA259A05 TaxID=1698259 RepID=A0A133UA21_9EURY|nr:hypothetical protein AKJ57_02640 [candidate division MSBL1 archaeon SCGC-AAA259A05]